MQGVAAFAAGESGWFAIDASRQLWHGAHAAPQRVADDVVAACIGDGADYFVTRDGTLWVKGLAHRGQYGDGRLAASPDFVTTAGDAVAVKAHTGHAIYLRRDGVVLGTGGNRFGPLSSHGLGDKADRWGPIFDGARAIATGSRHSLAIRHDGSLWALGRGLRHRAAQAARRRARRRGGRHARRWRSRADGALWQWDGGGGRRLLKYRRADPSLGAGGSESALVRTATGGPVHARRQGPGAGQCLRAVHRPSQALRPGRRRHRFSSPLQRA